MPTTTHIVWNLIKLPFTLLSTFFMVVQLVILYYLYSNRDRIVGFVNDVHKLIKETSTLITDIKSKLSGIDEISPKLDEALKLLKDIQNSLPPPPST